MSTGPQNPNLDRRILTRGAGGGGLLVATAHLSAPEILTLFSSPAELIPAPGPNRAIIPTLIEFDWKPGQVSYEMVATFVTYNGDLANGQIAETPANAILRFSIPQIGTSLPLLSPATTTHLPRALVENSPLTIQASENTGTQTDPPGNPLARGPIVTSSLADGGADYAPGDTGTIDFDEIAAYQVDTVDVDGAVLTYHLTNPGDGYDLISNPLSTTPSGIQPGAGSGLEVNCDSIPPADGDLYITALYRLLTLH